MAGAFGRAKGGPERQAAALGILGKSYKDIIPLFAQGNKGLQEQLHWADEFGSTLNGQSLESVMAMVTAQREFKASMFGLQVQATTHLLPAIHAVDDEVNTLASTLANPKLTEEQKFSRISHQFLNLENNLLGILEKALPKIAEKGGELGVRLAEAVWNGFKNSGLTGKLVISAWLLKFMGGGGLIKSVAGTAGKTIARGLLWALFPALAEEFAVTGSLGLMIKNRWLAMGEMSGRIFTVGIVIGAGIGAATLGWKLGEIIDEKTHGAFRWWTKQIAMDFVNGLVREINEGMDKANILSFLGVSAPNISEINLHTGQEEVAHGVHKTHHNLPPGQIPPGSEGPGTTEPSHSKHHPKHQQTPRRQMGGSNKADFVPRPQHIHLHWNGREVASGVLQAGEDAMALR